MKKLVASILMLIFCIPLTARAEQTLNREGTGFNIQVKTIKNVVQNDIDDESEIYVRITDSEDKPIVGRYIRLGWESGYLGWYENTTPEDGKTNENGEITFYHSSDEIGEVTLRVIIGSLNDDYWVSTYDQGIETDKTVNLKFVKDTTDYTKPQALIKLKNSSTVYFLDKNNIRHAYPTKAVYENYWAKKKQNIKIVSANKMAEYALGNNVPFKAGTLVRFPSRPKNTYEILDGAVIRLLKDDNTVKYFHGENWQKKVVELPEAQFPDYGMTYSVKIDVIYD